MTFFLEYEFVQRAIIAGTLIGILCSVLGVFLVLRRLSLLGDGLSHAAFTGVAVGMLLKVYPLFSAMIVTAIASLGVRRLTSKLKIYGDSAIAVVFSLGLGLAIVIIGAVKGFNADLLSYLFGSILTINNVDLLAVGVVSLIVLGFLYYKRRDAVFLTFNEDVAITSGVNVELFENIFSVATALVIVVAMRAVGILLVSSLIVIPALIAFQIANSFKRAIIIAALSSVFAIWLGISLAWYLDLPPGGLIAIILCVMFGLAAIWKRSKIRRQHIS
ncbi:MAG: metal ABC transporter permease [Candidatus Bilamarchaeum sp.]|jgi:zinc transport system permease protein